MSSDGVRNGTVRIVLGLLQGFGLYFLNHAMREKIWPATDHLLFAPLELLVAVLPLVVLFGLGNMRTRTLLSWTGGAAALLMLLGLHDGLREMPGPRHSILTLAGPSWMLMDFTLLGVFIAHALIAAGDADRRYIAAYPRYFDTAWKLELQILLTTLFTGLFWLLLWLGAELLDLIDVRFLHRLIEEAGFAYPATSVAVAVAIHLTDVRPAIVSGMRSLIHIVLSWLLPMIVLIVAIFLLSLPVVGLHLLWQTNHATSLLLAVAAVTIVLANAVYRDGTQDFAAPRVLRIAASLGVAELVPIVGIAAFAVGLRVEQHGWTVSRLFAAAAVLVAGCYTTGYVLALVRRGPWLRGLERANVATSFVILAVFLALLTPVADPARIAVSSQIALLKSGRVAPSDFDYRYLRWHGERYGQEALEALKGDLASDKAVRAGAERALASTFPGSDAIRAPTETELAAAITAYPDGRKMPDSFLQQRWQEDTLSLPLCLTNVRFRCDAFFIDLDGDGIEEIVLMPVPQMINGTVFKLSKDGTWRRAGTLDGRFFCSGVIDGLRAGKYSLSASPWRDLDVAGHTIRMSGLPDAGGCH
jgi:hypothetical protein